MEVIKISYNIDLYKFNKKVNSLKFPTVSPGYSASVLLKENCSILHPVFILQGKKLSEISLYNYLQFNDRFYFIDDIISIGGLRNEIHASVDVLATYVDDIWDYTCQFARTSDPTYYNDMIYDNMCQATSEIKEQIVITGSVGPKQFSRTDTSTTVSIFGDDGNLLINSTYDPAGLISEVFDDSSWWNNLVNSDNSPEQYVKDMIILPLRYDLSNYGHINDDVGTLAMDITKGYNISNPSDRDLAVSYTFDLSNFSITNWSHDDFRNYNSNFVSAELHLPFAGNIAIDPKYLQLSSIVAIYQVDMGTGTGVLRVSAIDSDSKAFEIVNMGVNVGVAVQYSASTLNTGMQMTLVNDAIGVATGLAGSMINPGNAISAVGSAVQTAVDMQAMDSGRMYNYSTQGSLGSVAQWQDFSANLFINARKSTNRAGYTPQYGRPALGSSQQIRVLSSGAFCQVVAPSININGAFREEENMINQYLQNGFYQS